MYSLFKTTLSSDVVVRKNQDESITSFFIDSLNTDYQQFKADILSGTPLQDAEGNTLSQTEAEAFIATLP